MYARVGTLSKGLCFSKIYCQDQLSLVISSWQVLLFKVTLHAEHVLFILYH